VAELAYREALRRAMVEEMRADDRVFLMGEEVAFYDGAYKVSQGMLAEFGARRVIDTPIAENGFVGLCVGAAMGGLRPIVEVMTWNFAFVAFDPIVNGAAKIVNMTAGQYRAPMVIRGPTGAPGHLGSQHSMALESTFAHFPGLEVVSPSTPADAYGLLRTAIRSENPTCFFESESLYALKGEVPDAPYTIPLGVADWKRPGRDVTLVSWNKQVHTCLAAAELLASRHGVDAGVLDLRTLRPLDEEALFDAARRTHRIVVVQEGWPVAGFAAEIAARVQEACFDDLDAPVKRVTNLDVNQPYAANLEALVLPSPARVVDAALATLGRGGS
jgi:pyruvate dehydrogenase E1 component beta subunit